MFKDPFRIYTEQDDIKDKEITVYHQDKDIDGFLSGNLSSDSLKIALTKKHFFWILTVIVIIFLIILSRLFYLQILKGDNYRILAEGNRIRVLSIPSARGLIYDRYNLALTKNIPNFYLQIIPSDLPKDKDKLNAIIALLSSNLGIDEKETQLFFDSLPSYSYQPKIFRELIDHDTAIKLKVLTSTTPGISLEMSAIREYPFPEEFAHVLGYTGKMTEEEYEEDKENYLITDYIGKTGLELQYEKELKGKNGKKEIEVDSLGKEKKEIANEESKIGYNLITTLDKDLQLILHEHLEKAVSANRAKGGAALAIDPRNGEILAIVSSSSYDVNKFVRGISVEDYQQLIEDQKKPLFFKTIAGEYPSGSTIKPLIASAALQEGIITSTTTVNSVGGIQIDKWFFPDWKTGGHGITNVVKAIAESVNTFFYIISGGQDDFKGLGIDKITSYAKLFGLNQKTGIDLPNEANGFLPSKEWKESVKKESWYIGDTYHLAIGQGDLLVTPLQIANLTAIIANGGIYYKPHLLKQFTDSQNNIVSKFGNEVIRKDFIKKEYINIVRQGMREAVLSGSSQSMNDLSVTTAGKTGTAQYSFGNHAWFTCFAPYENPEIVITVLIEKGGEGHIAALPVAKNTLKWYFSK